MKRALIAVGGLRHWRVQWKLVVVVVGPTLVAAVLAVSSAFQSWGSVADYDQATDVVRFGGQVNELVDALQQERDVTAVYVASGRAVGGDQVTAARTEVDVAVDEYFDAVADLDTSDSEVLREDVRQAEADLDGLAFVRDAVTSASLTEGAIRATYTDTIAALYSFVVYNPGGTDSAMSGDLRVLGDIFQIKEYASQARAELGAILSSGAFAIGKLQDYTGILARQRAAVDAFQADSTDAQRTAYANAVQGQAVSQVQTDQTAAVEQATADQLTIDPNASFTASTEKLALLRTVQSQLQDGAIATVDGLHDEALLSAWIAIGTLALVVILAAVVSAAVARSMSRSLRKLRSSAMHVAENWLPEVTERLRHTNVQAVNEVELARVEIDAHDEIGEVARAFDAIAAACARLVREQADLRGSMNSGFINLARRNQACAERILRALDEWERDELDADRLHRLFVIDHLATRMRRTDDSLMIIAGAQTITKRTNPSSLDDVVSAALAEVEHYTRIHRPFTGNAVTVVGHAVPDVVHLLSELLDNATAFSPPNSTVSLSFSRTPTYPDSIIVTVRDRGVGMTPSQIEEANQRIVSPEAIHGSMVRSMGLIVVGRLAARHGISVKLRTTDGGGITATVVLPASVLLGQPKPPAPEWRIPPKSLTTRGTQPSMPAVRQPHPSNPPHPAYPPLPAVQQSHPSLPHRPVPPPPPPGRPGAAQPLPPITEDSPFHQTNLHGTDSRSGDLGPSTPLKSMSLTDAVKMRRHQRGLERGENDQN